MLYVLGSGSIRFGKTGIRIVILIFILRAFALFPLPFFPQPFLTDSLPPYSHYVGNTSIQAYSVCHVFSGDLKLGGLSSFESGPYLFAEWLQLVVRKELLAVHASIGFSTGCKYNTMLQSGQSPAGCQIHTQVLTDLGGVL